MDPPQFALPLNESREVGGTLAARSPPDFRHMTPFPMCGLAARPQSSMLPLSAQRVLSGTYLLLTAQRKAASTMKA